MKKTKYILKEPIFVRNKNTKNMEKKPKKSTVLWLFLSSFGIMFAALSWIQESNLINADLMNGPNKGFLAVLTGMALYYFLAKKTL